jgi:hypothetical protein
VLGILRLIREANPNHTAAQLIQEWAGDKAVISQSAILKVASYVTEQVDEAKVIIANSDIDPESRHGVDKALEGLTNAFSLGNLGAHPRQKMGDVSVAISSVKILLQSGGLSVGSETPEDAVELAKQVEELMNAFNDGDLDPNVREIAKRHLQILATMLRHLPIFGLEAAMTTYFELVLRVKRANEASGASQKAAAKPLLERIKSVGATMKSWDDMWTVAVKWIGIGKAGAKLLGLYP